MAQYTYKKRAFFASPEDDNGYVSAIVESSEKGSYPLGNYILALADCRRSLELDFSLSSLTLIKRSLAKADLIVETVIGFRKALRKEAKLIRDYKGEEFKKLKAKSEDELSKVLEKVKTKKGKT